MARLENSQATLEYIRDKALKNVLKAGTYYTRSVFIVRNLPKVEGKDEILIDKTSKN
ncbi:MAG: hypothetical protein OQJ89_02070 [Kangiellaceae bacterium]|nr:hypothetical protein [Kangiellaceae bacterium]MCW8998344.1 hypothetical protein [Kangiellaceae bacterium]MCW9015731.1 hypothetical protein [Kangiellaceae bacterium]